MSVNGGERRVNTTDWSNFLIWNSAEASKQTPSTLIQDHQEMTLRHYKYFWCKNKKSCEKFSKLWLKLLDLLRYLKTFIYYATFTFQFTRFLILRNAKITKVQMQNKTININKANNKIRSRLNCWMNDSRADADWSSGRVPLLSSTNCTLRRNISSAEKGLLANNFWILSAPCANLKTM